METYDHGVAQMDAYRHDFTFTEAARQAHERASITVSPEQLTVYRYLARTAWERLRQEGRRQGLVWFDPEYRVVPDFQRRHGPYGAKLITVAIGVVHDGSYTDRDGYRRESVAPGRMQVSVQLPKEEGRFPALWVSDFNEGAGPTDADSHHCERVDWHDPARLKGERR